MEEIKNRTEVIWAFSLDPQTYIDREVHASDVEPFALPLVQQFIEHASNDFKESYLIHFAV